MNYDEKLLNEAAEIRNRNAQRIKKWIYEGEQRAPRTGEHYLYDSGSVGFVPPTIVITADFPILHPVPDDVVMVPRSKIEALRPLAEESFVLVSGFSRGFETTGRVIKGGDKHALDDLLDCAKPVEEEDAILEALKRACNVEFPGSVTHDMATRAIALREAELKARKS